MPAPREIPRYKPGTGLVRLGYVTDLNGEDRLVGVPIRELLFSARFGKAGFGKTEEALAQAIEIARLGGGVWFLDPHADGWKSAKPYLSDPNYGIGCGRSISTSAGGTSGCPAGTHSACRASPKRTCLGTTRTSRRQPARRVEQHSQVERDLKPLRPVVLSHTSLATATSFARTLRRQVHGQIAPH
jgi:hypothetical protein